jgi:hypothetical protein
VYHFVLPKLWSRTMHPQNNPKASIYPIFFSSILRYKMLTVERLSGAVGVKKYDLYNAKFSSSPYFSFRRNGLQTSPPKTSSEYQLPHDLVSDRQNYPSCRERSQGTGYSRHQVLPGRGDNVSNYLFILLKLARLMDFSNLPLLFNSGRSTDDDCLETRLLELYRTRLFT